MAFSRKQIITPALLDIDAVISDIGKMIKRLIGEDVELVLDLNSTGMILADRSQMEQVVLNLVVNARDAMTQGGRIEIHTRTVQLTSAHQELIGSLLPGLYTEIAVRDNGAGIPDDVKAHLFEPFFTTKPAGKGTGMGLAMVYGIVVQSGGAISIDSEVGCGSEFKVHLPSIVGCPGAVAINRKVLNDGERSSGGEVLLLVEDEDQLRNMTTILLRSHGFEVLEARNGVEALQAAASFKREITLVITDVVMPLMGGRQLVEELGVLRPETKVLFMSGHTDDSVVRYGIVELDAAFLQKPFTPNEFITKVRQVLCNSDATAAGSLLCGNSMH